MKTNRQNNRAKARKDAAQQAAKLQATAEYLQKHKAWNWVWPGPSDGALLMDTQPLQRNCWYTGLRPKGRNPSRGDMELQGTHPYTGPSKRTLKKRQARRPLTPNEESVLHRSRVT